MSDIARSMKAKGYKPLAADAKGGIAFRRSTTKENNTLLEPVWFDTGMKMKGPGGKEVPRTVCATDEADCEEYARKGWTPVVKKQKKSRVIDSKEKTGTKAKKSAKKS